MNQVMLENGVHGLLSEGGDIVLYESADGTVTDLSGLVAIRYYQPTQKMVRMGDGTEYLFRTEHSSCICWVKPEHVDYILSIKHQCCGNNWNPAFRKAGALAAYSWRGYGDR